MRPLVRRKFPSILCILNILVTLTFVPGCQKTRLPELTQKEREQVEPLLNFILFEHPGVFVLFGSKPMSACSLPPRESYTEEEWQRHIATLPEQLRAQLSIVKCNLNEQWEGWKRVSTKFPAMKNFLLVERNRDLFLLDVEKCSKVVSRQYPFFKQLVGNDFSVREAVFEIQNEKSLFWDKVFSNHRAMGLLFGFGEENIQRFEEKEKRYFSSSEAIPFGQSNAQIFSIPMFVTQPNDPVVLQYKKERDQIYKIYEGKDALQVSLQRLHGF